MTVKLTEGAGDGEEWEEQSSQRLPCSADSYLHRELKHSVTNERGLVFTQEPL